MSENKPFDLEAVVLETTTKAVENYLKKKKKKGVRTKHVVLDRLFPIERRVFSIIHGLQTSLGTTLWEPLADNLYPM